MQKNNDFKPYIPAEKITPELTVTSIIMGVILAVVFGAANAYLGLRVGMTVSASIPAAAMVNISGCGELEDTSSGVGKNESISSGISESEKSFSFVCVFADKTQKKYEITSDKKTVGEALVEEGLIAGENGPYGLYVKTVCGVTLDYDKDGKYWAFYVGDTMASAGVDSTEIVDGETYSFKAE